MSSTVRIPLQDGIVGTVKGAKYARSYKLQEIVISDGELRFVGVPVFNTTRQEKAVKREIAQGEITSFLQAA